MASPSAQPLGARAAAGRSPSGGTAGAVRWLLSCAVVAVLLGLGAWLGLWWLPFAAGAGVGLTAWRARSAVCWGALAVIAGWGVTLWIPALLSEPAGATARSVAALAGLPPHAAVAVAATLLVGVLQSLVALWLIRAIRPRR
jgi:hypothetical protein